MNICTYFSIYTSIGWEYPSYM